MKNKFQCFILLFIAFVGIQCTDTVKFSTIERILKENGIGLSSNDKLIVYNDNSCEVCFRNLQYYVDHQPSSGFRLLYTTGSKKLTYENSLANGIVKKDQFHLITDLSLYDEVAKATNDYKGLYLLSVKDNHISHVEAIDNSQ